MRTVDDFQHGKIDDNMIRGREENYMLLLFGTQVNFKKSNICLCLVCIILYCNYSYDLIFIGAVKLDKKG